MKKKTIYQLRQELIDAEEHFDVLHFYGDHIVIILPCTMLDVVEKKQKLKQYIETTFEKVVNINTFVHTDHIVIWHDFEIIPEYQRRMKRYNS